MLVDTHANQDPQRDNLALDSSVYANDNVPAADTKAHFSMMELFIEFKLAEISDPFRDPKDPLQPQANNFRFENDSDVSRLVSGHRCLAFGFVQVPAGVHECNCRCYDG